jgi:hypothetical protein
MLKDPHLTPPMRRLAEGVLADLGRNLEMLAAEPAPDAAHAALARWAAHLGGLAADVFEALVVLLDAGKTRAAYVLSRALIDQHVRLRYYVVQAREAAYAAGAVDAVRDWDGPRIDDSVSLYEPDEWSDEEQQRIGDAFGAAPPHAEQLRVWCAYLEEHEKNENAYRWARAAWLVEEALGRGDPAFAGDGAGDAPTIFFDALWYVLDLMDSVGMIYGWAYGAVKNRQDAIKLYLTVKPDAGKT